MCETSLYHAPMGERVRIKALKLNGSIRRRLLDMGLTEGAETVCLYQSPTGDPKAYFIRGAVIALRSEEAKKIGIEVIA